VQRLRPEVCQQKKWLLHHNNAPIHSWLAHQELSFPIHLTLLCFPYWKQNWKAAIDTTEVIEADALRPVHMRGRKGTILRMMVTSRHKVRFSPRVGASPRNYGSSHERQSKRSCRLHLNNVEL
jgi:hypothetical protein